MDGELKMIVSVLMQAYNAERYIAEAIESVLNQTYKNFELIVINDGSTDNTLDIIEEFARQDERIKVVSHPNMGMGASLNKGIAIAKNEWIIRMDADDVMLPHRIERQVAFVSENPDIAVAGCLVYYIDELGKIIGKSASDLKTRRDFKRYLDSNELIGVSHPGVIMRKSVVQEVGGYRPQYWPADDIDLWNRVAERGYLILVQQEYLLKYRIHGSSVSVYDSMRARQMVRWIKENMIRRRSGQAELSLEEFRQLYEQRPLLHRMNQERKDLAKVFYKRAVFSYSKRQFIDVFLNAFVVLLLQPSYVINQARHKSVWLRRKV